jgi:sigma-B regulation protein RsbU (phosphoserine phosphatase)
MYLLDVCGHGVKAALLSISAITVLRNQTLPATDFRSPGEVLAGLNKVFQMDRHNDMYFTMWYGVFDKKRRKLTYANGGHPPAILMAGPTQDTAEAIKLSQPGMVIGAFPEVQFEAEVRDLPAFSRLYVFSDGVYEVTRPGKAMMSYEEFMEVLNDSKRSAESVLEDTMGAIRTLHGGDQFEDDVSMMEVRF